VAFPLGVGVGSTMISLDLLPVSLLAIQPTQWDIETPNIKLYLPAIPDC